MGSDPERLGEPLEPRRVDILMLALNGRYDALHKIRERAQSIGVWAIGLSIAASTWLLQVKTPLHHFEKGLLVLGIAISYWAVRMKYIGDLERGFRSQQVVAARIEEALGLYTPQMLSEGVDSIYPPAWRDAGTVSSQGQFFDATNTLLDVAFGFLFFSVIFSGVFFF
ncbi:MAG TPA: hypothetical protein VHX92_09625 [Rhizomicrobium sp.]|jgi:hypothetical protein|nr:hypothetical protein [Rhizomicrobium sp.]